MNRYIILAVLSVLAFIVACTSDSEDPIPCDTSGITYTNEIAAIFNSSCANSSACHNANASSTFSLANYANVESEIPNNRISGSINHRSGFDAMPKGASKLNDCTISKIDQWLADGAPE